MSAHRSNNLDALRLLGALAVIVGHGYVLTGRAAPVVLGYELQTLGVVVFFAISGYLITASWSRNPQWGSYLAARCLRIFPALVVVVVVTVFVLGPLVTRLATGEYFDRPLTWTYLRNVVLHAEFWLPGVFEGLPSGRAVNGSLWTLRAEFACYLLVPLLCLVPRRGRAITFAAFGVVAFLLAQVPPADALIVYGGNLTYASEMWVFFAAGGLLRLARERWTGLFRLDVAAGLLLLHVAVLLLRPALVPDVSWLSLPYVVLAVGLASTPVVRDAARFGDFSYGLYLYAYPVQQVLVQEWGPQRMLVNLPVVTAITLVLAVGSWWAVERPSLALKDRVQARAARRAGAHAARS